MIEPGDIGVVDFGMERVFVHELFMKNYIIPYR